MQPTRHAPYLCWVQQKCQADREKLIRRGFLDDVYIHIWLREQSWRTINHPKSETRGRNYKLFSPTSRPKNEAIFYTLLYTKNRNLDSFEEAGSASLSPHEKSGATECQPSAAHILDEHRRNRNFPKNVLFTGEATFARNGNLNLHYVHERADENPHTTIVARSAQLLCKCLGWSN